MDMVRPDRRMIAGDEVSTWLILKLQWNGMRRYFQRLSRRQRLRYAEKTWISTCVPRSLWPRFGSVGFS